MLIIINRTILECCIILYFSVDLQPMFSDQYSQVVFLGAIFFLSTSYLRSDIKPYYYLHARTVLIFFLDVPMAPGHWNIFFILYSFSRVPTVLRIQFQLPVLFVHLHYRREIELAIRDHKTIIWNTGQAIGDFTEAVDCVASFVSPQYKNKNILYVGRDKL